MTDLVIFDCDGVLIDSEIISAQMLIDELATLQVNIDLDYVARHFLGRSYPTVMKQIRSEFGLDLPEEFEAQYRARLLDAFERDLRVTQGVANVLEALDVPWCVATSSSLPRAERSLEIAGLRDRVGDRLFTASEVAHGKPAPDLFLHAAEKMGASPARTLVIEDSLNGIRAGLAAGMEVWRFTGGSHLAGRDLTPPEDARPHREFAHFTEFFQNGVIREKES
ncbi:hydrolase [Thioclava sp. F42-5]|uniref:HAD family hydrolase n=1 Tax=Thioclava sp. F42-5 TaxID=1973005 RepID=UPI000B54715A|nr:HAD family hydrolase [Thioclava sp. F42-5]OWY10616.1 hydrolase [Thioclava sp. F42-5]